MVWGRLFVCLFVCFSQIAGLLMSYFHSLCAEPVDKSGVLTTWRRVSVAAAAASEKEVGIGINDGGKGFYRREGGRNDRNEKIKNKWAHCHFPRIDALNTTMRYIIQNI